MATTDQWYLVVCYNRAENAFERQLWTASSAEHATRRALDNARSMGVDIVNGHAMNVDDCEHIAKLLGTLNPAEFNFPDDLFLEEV